MRPAFFLSGSYVLWLRIVKGFSLNFVFNAGYNGYYEELYNKGSALQEGPAEIHQVP